MWPAKISIIVASGLLVMKNHEFKLSSASDVVGLQDFRIENNI